MPRTKSIPRTRRKALVGGRFEVERLIGQGGMGEVFAAKHVITGRRVALKVVRPDGRTIGRTDRFFREARIVSALRHPNIVEVIDAFEDAEGAAVLVMELLVGETLSAYRGRAGTLSLGEASEILVPVARALLAAHRSGVVHRDLKPDNIFLAVSGCGRPIPKVLDFGIAKVLDSTELGAGLDGQSTNTGAIVGTPNYMAFEQAMSEKDVDCRADIWSLGVILFEALTGRRPIEFDSLGQMYKAFLQGSIPSAREVLPDLPSNLVELLDRCLVIDRRGRLDGLESFIETLAPYEAPSAGASRPRGPTAPPAEHAGGSMRAFRVAAVIGATAVALTAGVGVTAVAIGPSRFTPSRTGRVEMPVEASQPSPSVDPSERAAGLQEPPVGTAAGLGAPPTGTATARSETHGLDARPGSRVEAASKLAALAGPGVSATAAPVAAPRTPPSASVSSRVAGKTGIFETPPY